MILRISNWNNSNNFVTFSVGVHIAEIHFAISDNLFYYQILSKQTMPQLRTNWKTIPLLSWENLKRICRQMSLVCLLHLQRRTLDLEVVMTYLSEITEMALETQNVGLL